MAELKEMVTYVKDKNQKSPEDREYLICLNLETDGECGDFWEVVKGRRTVYEVLKHYIKEYDVNFEISFILVESLKLEERRSIYSFMKYCEQYFDTDPFDVDDYVKGDWNESDFQEANDIVDDLGIQNTQKLSMEDIINGNVETTQLN